MFLKKIIVEHTIADNKKIYLDSEILSILID